MAKCNQPGCHSFAQVGDKCGQHAVTAPVAAQPIEETAPIMATERDVEFLISRGYKPEDVADAQRALDRFAEEGTLAGYIAERDGAIPADPLATED